MGVLVSELFGFWLNSYIWKFYVRIIILYIRFLWNRWILFLVFFFIIIIVVRLSWGVYSGNMRGKDILNDRKFWKCFFKLIGDLGLIFLRG